MIEYNDKNTYWNYFISIEDDLYKLSRYIEFDKQNENVFSTEIVRLLISASSEFEVVMRNVCLLINREKEYNSIKEIRNEVYNFKSEIAELEIVIKQYGLKYSPLLNWKNDKNGDWWEAYNAVKHHRSDSFHQANLINLINSIGALYIANLYYFNLTMCKEKNSNILMEETTIELKPHPRLLKVNKHEFYMIPLNTAYYD